MALLLLCLLLNLVHHLGLGVYHALGFPILFAQLDHVLQHKPAPESDTLPRSLVRLYCVPSLAMLGYSHHQSLNTIFNLELRTNQDLMVLVVCWM